MADRILVDSLAEFYSAEEIRGFWKQALDALIARNSTVIQITSLSEDGQSSSGVALNSPAELRGFIETCKAAIRQIDGDSTIDPDELDRGTDWSLKRVRV